MRVAVTGGSGFIGSSLIAKLAKKGHEAVVLSNTPPKSSFGDPVFQECDVTDKKAVDSSLEGCDAVIHLAALKSMEDSIRMVREYNKVNIDGTVNVLEAARERGIKKFVFASSSAVYGNSEAPQKETMVPFPNNPYGLTKLAGEHYCSAYSENFGLETVSLRIFNPFGPGQESQKIIPAFFRCAISGEHPTIFGSGNQARDFVYISDVSDAFVKALENSGRAAGRAINIGSGRSLSLNDVLQKIGEITGKKLEPLKRHGMKGDLERTFADVSLAKKLLGWKPKTGFEEGLRKTYGSLRGVA